MSYLTELTCSVCGKGFSADIPQTYCATCQAPLLTQYDLAVARCKIDREAISWRPRGMWRWHELLPLHQPEFITSLGEGDAPLISLARLGSELGLPNLYLKDESRNPTGTFKARGLSAAISKARELGLSKFIIPTAGNAGGALAAYSVRAGAQACIIMPKDTPQANLSECRIAGVEVILVDGLISDAARLADQRARSESWFDLSTFKEPYRVEGKKVMGYELAESFGWKLPDVIIYPTGGGTGLAGMWKAFSELKELGWLESNSRPQLVAVQADGCAPIVRALQDGAEACQPWPGAHTTASGLRVPKSFADRLILRCLRESQGAAISVSDIEIWKAQRRLAATEGILAAPEGAATLAALHHLIQSDWINPHQRIVLFNTGSGLKYTGSPGSQLRPDKK
jgi:threonine synthase